MITDLSTKRLPTINTKNQFPCVDSEIPRYVAQRTEQVLPLDGRLEHPAWQKARRSANFRDLVHATPTLYETNVAVLWDDNCLLYTSDAADE